MRRSHVQKVTKQEAETINARTWLDRHPILGGALIGTGAALATAALAYGATKAYPYAEFAYGELVTAANELDQLAKHREAILHVDEPIEPATDPARTRLADELAQAYLDTNDEFFQFEDAPDPKDLAQDRKAVLDEFTRHTLEENEVKKLPHTPIKGVKSVPMTLEQRRRQHRYHQESLPGDFRKVMFETPPEVSREEAVRKQHARTTEEEWLKGPDYGIEPSQPLPTPYPTKLYKWPLLERHLQVALKNHENKDLRTIDLRNSKNRDPYLEDQLRSRYNHITKGMRSTTQDQVNLRKIARKKVMAEVDQYTQRLLTPGYQNPEVQRYQALLEAYTSS